MIGVQIIARLGSTRLPGKHLIDVKGKTLLQHLVNRLGFILSKNINEDQFRIVISTADELENRKFEQLSYEYPLAVFYGNIHNIPLRQLECALEYNFDQVISIDGDDIIVSSEAIEAILKEMNTEYHMIKSVGLPLGMNVFCYKQRFLENSLNKIDSLKLETGWGRIFDESKIESIRVGDYIEDSKLRFTLDYPEDAIFFKTIIDHFKGNISKQSDKSIIDYVINNKVYLLNGFLNEQYWNNFNKDINNESNDIGNNGVIQ